jgi:heme-degrading monooxygenase HmoA
MYCRLIRLKGTPDKVDEGVKLWTADVMPALKKQGGFAGAALLGNRETGEGFTVTYWETEKAMKEARDRVRPEGLKVLTTTGGSIVEEHDCEVAVLERYKPAKAGMFVRMTFVKSEATHVSEGISNFKAKLVPVLEKQPGVRSAYYFVNRQTGKTFAASAWDTKKDLQNSETSIAELRKEAITKLNGHEAKTEIFEVYFAEILAPAATSSH